jgi:signal transduction histidine kinase
MLVRTRIIGVAVLASAIATFLFGVPLALAVLRHLMGQERGHLVRVANDVAIHVADHVEGGSPIEPEDVTDVGDDGEDLTAAVFDADGELLAGVAPDGDLAVLAEALDGDIAADVDGDVLVAAAPVTHGQDVVGAVVVSEPRNDVLAEVALIWTAMAGLALVAVTVAWLVGRRQAGRLAGPLEDLEDRARRLGDGDFSVRSRHGGVPEIDSVGAALDTTAARLDDMLARERAFSADASHQLRTPLAGLRLRVEAALEQRDQDPWPVLLATLADADRLQATIEELQLLARAGHAGSTEPLDLGALTGELSPEWGARLALHGRDLVVRVDPDAPDARASAPAVRQVLAVLIDNATVHGAGPVTVAVRAASGAVAVDVADEGPGVSEPQGVLFSERAVRRDGHGVGLALARRLAEAEGGRLHLTQPSPPVFTLLLPAADATGMEEAGADASTSAGVLSSGPVP